MRFELQIIGLCVVIEASAEDDHHRIVPVDPEGADDVPDHDVYLSFDDENLDSSDGVRLEKQETQWRAKLPMETVVRLPEALGRELVLPAAEPARLDSLGLGGLAGGVGQGDFLDGEQGLALLPKANADAGWIGDVGSWRFPALGDQRFRAACTFIWGGRFEDRLRVDLDSPKGEAHIVLKPNDRYPGDTVKLAYSCIRWPEHHQGQTRPKPFGYCHAFKRVARTPDDFQPPESESLVEHAGSASCPPVGG